MSSDVGSDALAYLVGITAQLAPLVNSLGPVADTVTGAQFTYLAGATSNVQTQINNLTTVTARAYPGTMWPTNRIHNTTSVGFNGGGYTVNNGLVDFLSSDAGSSTSGPARVGGYSLYTITTVATANKAAYYVSSNSVADTTVQPFWSVFGKISTTSSIRTWMGFANGLNYQYTDSLPSVSFVGAVFRYSTSAGDTHFMAVTSNGTAQTVTDTHVAADTNPHWFAIYMPSAASAQFYIDGNLVATNTTTMPTGALWETKGVTTLTAATASYSFSRIDVETN